MKRVTWGVMLFLCIAAGTIALAQESIELERIVITPNRYAEDISDVPASVSVITQEDIEESGAQTVIDALRATPGLVVRDWFGNGARASVDARGFGELAGVNVLVLVDGRRVNQIDLSGTDWSQIPLDQVEKIEILRGGSGSVLYGDNATGAVVNIITKKGYGLPSVSAEAIGGSYDMNRQRVSVGGALKALSYWVGGSHSDTEGFRKNSYFQDWDFGSKFSYDINSELSVRFSSGYHDAIYGFPGALLEDDLAQRSRRDTKYPRDHGKDTDYYFILGSEKIFGQWGELSFDGSFRRKDMYSNFIDSNGGWNPFYRSRIDTIGITPKYVLERSVFSRPNTLIAGIDVYRSDYSSDNYDVSDVLQNYTDINKFSTGYYIQDELEIINKLVFQGGYRYERAKYEIDYHDNALFFPNPDVDTDKEPYENAYNAALTYKYMDNSNVFFNFSRSFRFPAADEYYTWGTLNTNLKPQTAYNYELGARHQFKPDVTAGLSLFLMDVHNELYYNPFGGLWGFGANENYDRTWHRGLELTFDAKVFQWLTLLGNYGYTRAYFNGGVYDDKDVPMVPRHKGSIGARFSLPIGLTLNVLGNYVGKRYFINDQANDFSPLNGYMVANVNVAYKYKIFTLTGGINNLFNKEYSEYGVYKHSIPAQKGYYPSPGRNFYAGVSFDF